MIKKFLGALFFGVFLFTCAFAQTIDQLGAGSAVSGTDKFPAWQGANPATAPTAAQIQTFVTKGIPPLYLGEFATRAGRNNNHTGPTTNQWQMTSYAHFARDRCTSPTAVLGNYTSNNNSDVTYGAGTVKLSIEYPIGATPVLSDQNIAAGNAAVSFPIGNNSFTFNGTTIPDGAKFGVRVLQVNSNGIPFFQFQSNDGASDPYDGWANGTGTPTDQTVTGTVPPNVITYRPVAVLCQTRKPSFIVIGDSREEGGTEGAVDTTSDIGIAARAIGRQFGYIQLGESGTTQANYNSGTRTYRDQLFQYVTHISNEYGINDIQMNSTTAAGLATLRATFAALYPTKVVIGQTVITTTASTDGWATTANQTVGPNAKTILQFNNLERAGITGEAFYWDVADVIDPFRTGLWPIGFNPAATTRNAAQFTAAIATSGGVTTMTVSAVASGALQVGDPIVSDLTTWTSGDVDPSTYIIALGTGTGNTGTYFLSRPQTITSRTMYTGGFGSNDGLHQTATLSTRIRDSGVIRLDLVQR